MRPTRLAAFSVALALAAVGAQAASAPPPQPTPGQVQAARDLFAAAAKDEEGSRWADALEKLHRVADVKLTAGVRYHIAFCEEKLGLIATALEHYSETRDSAERERSKEVIDLLKEPFLSSLRARVPTLTVEVPSDAPGAVVLIDDHPQPSGLWGVAVPVDPGIHRIEARAPGRQPFSRELTLREREITVLDVVLPPLASPAPLASPPPPSPPSPSPPPAPSTSTSTSPPPRSLLAPTLTTAGSLLLVGGGVAAFLLAGSAQTDARTQCLTRPTCDALRTPVRTWDALALGAWIGGAVLATTAVVLWASPGPTRSARVIAGPAQLGLEGSF